MEIVRATAAFAVSRVMGVFDQLLGSLELLVAFQALRHESFVFFLLAALLAVATLGSHLTMRQARQDPANDYFFSQVGPASLRDYGTTIAVTVVFCLFGLILWLFDSHAPTAIVALCIALATLWIRFVQAKKYWMHSIVPPADAPRE